VKRTGGSGNGFPTLSLDGDTSCGCNRKDRRGRLPCFLDEIPSVVSLGNRRNRHRTQMVFLGLLAESTMNGADDVISESIRIKSNSE